MTEQAYHNELDSVVSIQERSSRFLQHIYIELLRVIRPLEQEGSYKKINNNSIPNQAEIDFMSQSPRQSTLEDELDDDELLSNQHAQRTAAKQSGPNKPQTADMRHVLGFLN